MKYRITYAGVHESTLRATGSWGHEYATLRDAQMDCERCRDVAQWYRLDDGRWLGLDRDSASVQSDWDEPETLFAIEEVSQ